VAFGYHHALRQLIDDVVKYGRAEILGPVLLIRHTLAQSSLGHLAMYCIQIRGKRVCLAVKWDPAIRSSTSASIQGGCTPLAKVRCKTSRHSPDMNLLRKVPRPPPSVILDAPVHAQSWLLVPLLIEQRRIRTRPRILLIVKIERH
jgi:hypothetical protein